ncbi:serine/threonine-protein kinase [Calothrix sp. PCC 6303]|uniref:serine/threonine-protein kinase n=1 Tax=Calothrix sp. PCC 6303 TaxID=1170562 RepID=UPI0002A01133|nr:serine/threonine-protein kinase [Calothrix sp. PCC 6303]AFZ02624.1 serine/threonine protein kinase [Calothrix sp. PCC 6303]
MIGKILDGRYQIISKLGQGGFGTTFLAIDKKLPNNDQCVVKLFSPQVDDPDSLHEARRLFNNEAIVLNTLGSHDQIPRLLAHFEEDEQFYLVEEFVSGEELTHEINPGKKLTEEEVISLLKDILKILEFVHRHGVIHRDLKPSNLIRRKHDRQIVMIDFGSVKQLTSQTINIHQPSPLTVIVGTHGYMPSEQTQGLPRLCSDVYAVGIIAIQALTGLVAVSLPQDSFTGEILWREQLQSGQVSSRLADVLDKMVKYDFRQRYQSATEVLQALEKVTDASSSRKSSLGKIIIGLGITALIGIVTLGTLFKKDDTLEPYNIDNYGISIQRPKTWQPEERPDRITGNVVRFISPLVNNTDKYQENVNLVVQDLSENRSTLEQFTPFRLDVIKQSSPNIKIIQEGQQKLANIDAYQVTYTLQEDSMSLERLQIWTVKDRKAYILTYTAEPNQYSASLPTVKQMINSFQIIK